MDDADLQPNLPALDKEVELTYADLLAGTRSGTKVSGRSFTALYFLSFVGLVNIAMRVLGPLPSGFSELWPWFLLLFLPPLVIPLSVWARYRNLGPEGRKMRVVLGDDYLDYHLGSSLLRVAYGDVVSSAWTRHSVAMMTQAKMTLHLPRRMLDAASEELLRDRLAHSKAAPARARRGRLMRIVIVWLFLIVAFVLLWELVTHAG